MLQTLHLVKPGFIPPLDPDFRPAALANRNFRQAVAGMGIPLVIGLERADGGFGRFETMVFSEDHPRAGENLYYIERILKIPSLAARWLEGLHWGSTLYRGLHLRSLCARRGA